MDNAQTLASIFAVRTYLESMPDDLLFDSNFRDQMERELGEKVGMNTFFRASLAGGFTLSAGDKARTFRCQRPKKSLIQKLKNFLKQL
ncbi:MAG: hypothetical protein Q7T66_04770 [Herminiimonas sp.]|uniref:hypothetical protein n=1 Tax=Herminiimonas sp. TaxID=1926289 RepID=UPI002727C3FD|nr:hypothetical protein [Herminiimonas sp.]MDO9419958.1 hypothetical protein [Herminiimonas sp.]